MGLTARERQQVIAEIRQLTAQVDALSRRAQRLPEGITPDASSPPADEDGRPGAPDEPGSPQSPS